MDGKNKNQSNMEDKSAMNFLIYTFVLCSYLTLCTARDTMRHGDRILGDAMENNTLISAGGKFELGFFTLNESGSDEIRRYVGIWYHKFSPKTIVWVANRTDPLLKSSGVFRIAEDGNLQILDDTTGKSYWSTCLEKSSSSSNRSVTLMDTGNLELRENSNGQWAMRSLWESFLDPTDTFLPGMKMDENFKLTSWKDEGNPETGAFCFTQDHKRENRYVVMNDLVPYWKSGEAGTFFGSAKMPDSILNLLSNIISNPKVYFGMRLVIKSDGTIQYLKWDERKKAWSLLWWEPRDKCGVFMACGNFGSCNSKNRLTCKCLPGFKPKSPGKWNLGDFFGGCNRGKELCVEKNTKFLRLKMMKVDDPDSGGLPVDNETECRNKCLGDCLCQAYSFQPPDKSISQRRDSGHPNTSLCWTWRESLNNLQEDYARGREIFARVVSSDIGDFKATSTESTSRNCEPCGTTMIPYPLSTRPDCGDPLYFSFRCDNNSTGRVSFKASSGEYQVISIDQVTRKFVIQVQDLDNCEARNSRGKSLHLNQSLPFNVTNWCHAKDSHKGIVEIEIGWNLPPEPTCTSQANCTEWRHSTCTTAASDGKNDGKRRCLCNTNFQWDGVNLNCTGPQGHTLQASEDKLSSSRTKIALYLIVLLTVLSVIVLACIAFSFVLWRRKMAKQKEKRKLSERKNRAFRALNTERQIKDLMDSGEFKEDAERGIDVPFFDLESILAATNDFSDENKLGQGGYGPVYKGKFPGGQEIAIKRLSSVSGQGLQEFKNEVLLIARLQHRNLVRLRGYCMESDEKLLLYEYMPNKSLDFFIFDDTKSVVLDWVLRFDIMLGIARGLLYLHQDSRLRIIHRDLKTSNILLDQFMNPKISDFGLARMVEGRQTEANTSRVVGTYGYMAPEYALEGAFSVKSDVFSFGVVLLEIVSGKRNTRLVLSDQPLTLLGYAWRLWTENKVLDLMDQTLQESCIENQFIKCVNVGLLCVQEDPCERPNISNVITMLDSESAALPSPKQPAFVVRRGSSTASSSSKPETNTEITFSLEDGR